MISDKLIVFEYKRSTSILIRLFSAIIFVFIFFAYVICIYNIKPVNNFVSVSSFLLTMMGANYFIGLLVSPLLYKNVAELYFSENKLILSRKNQYNKEYDPHEIQSIDFYYAGDIAWRSMYPIFQKYKSRHRYRISRSLYSIELDLMDSITINSKSYLVKIKNLADKKYFYKIVEWADRSHVKYNIVKSKYLDGEFK
jgi:hypothetical protein